MLVPHLILFDAFISWCHIFIFICHIYFIYQKPEIHSNQSQISLQYIFASTHTLKTTCLDIDFTIKSQLHIVIYTFVFNTIKIKIQDITKSIHNFFSIELCLIILFLNLSTSLCSTNTSFSLSLVSSLFPASIFFITSIKLSTFSLFLSNFSFNCNITSLDLSVDGGSHHLKT